MKNGHKLRIWVTPMTIGSFVMSALTGIMLFFKLGSGLVKPIHEWLSWLLVISAMLHMFVNWRLSVQYLAKPVGKGLLAILTLLICLSFLPGDGGPREEHQIQRMSNILNHAPLSQVAKIANHEPAEMVNILKSSGLNIESREQTIQDTAVKNKKTSVSVLDIIF